MAVTPAQGSNGSKQASGGARFRQRKISVKQPLTIYKHDELPTLDATNELEPSQVHHLNSGSGTQQRDMHHVETGVDKNEEDEVHLQQVIHAAQKALLNSKGGAVKDNKKQQEHVYIPTPDASKIWPEASRFYDDHKFQEPDSYIKFSATVEDTLGVEYNMDEIDEEFYIKTFGTNEGRKDSKSSSKKNMATCSEYEFELICDRFEKTLEEKQPFISTDPESILSYKELSAYIVEDYNSSNSDKPYLVEGSLKYMNPTTLKEKLAHEVGYNPFKTLYDKDPWNNTTENTSRSIPKLMDLFGEKIYEHWKKRKIERHGKPIFPSLKFEDPNATEKDNDSDPYICFRRREFRQARKTRRADTLGAERIRLLQRTMQKARDLVLRVSRREILELQVLRSEERLFNMRCEAKVLKRTLGVKGDDNLFYPHKKKRIIKPKIDDEDKDNLKSKREKRSKYDNSRDSADQNNSGSSISSRDKGIHNFAASHQDGGNVSQPYVKLPPSKIPDMDLVTVSLVLREKNETIKRAVLEKLRKRKEQDKTFINLTDDPYQPYFNITTDETNDYELGHIPYSSIAANQYHQFNTANTLSDKVRNLLEDGKKPLPGMKSFRGSNGELIPSKEFPHLSTLLQEHFHNNSLAADNYISQLLSNIETSNFNAYNVGYGHSQRSPTETPDLSEPIFRLRKRIGRSGRLYVDRRGVFKESELNYLNENDNLEGENGFSPDGIKNVYDSLEDQQTRQKSRWKFDDDMTEHEKGLRSPFSLDPSNLNCISDDTQSIRFGSMLLSKSYDLLREAMQQRQHVLRQSRARLAHSQGANSSRSSGDSNAQDLSRKSAQVQSHTNSTTSTSPQIHPSTTTALGTNSGIIAKAPQPVIRTRLPSQGSIASSGPLLESQNERVLKSESKA